MRAPGAAVRAAAPALRGRRGRGRRCGTYRGRASDGLQRASDAVCEAEQHLTACSARAVCEAEQHLTACSARRMPSVRRNSI